MWYGSNYQLEVKVGGRPVTEYPFNGNTFIEGRKGSQYSIAVRNSTGRRVSAVISVDGLSIVDGQPAGLDSPGYIIPAHTTQEFQGWLKDEKTMQAFYFSSRGRSYSSRSGQNSNNNGVIGVMLFEEYQPYTYQYNMPGMYYSDPFGIASPSGIRGMSSGYFGSISPTVNVVETDYSSIGQNAVFTASAAPVPESSLGTGWGHEIDANVKEENFVKKNFTAADAVLALYYDDKKGLERMGIIIDPRRYRPDPFPRHPNPIKRYTQEPWK